jgi:predicted helicase
MSRQLIQAYFNEIDRLKKFSGTTTEGVISEAFKDLLKAWSRQQNLQFLAQYQFLSNLKTQIRPDGTILHDLRVPLGYWEAKDEDDDLDVEIEKKLRRGYPQDNIIFEDSREAVLIQNRQPVMRCSITDSKELYRLLTLFFSYERQEIADFRKAVKQFRTDMPAVLEALRAKISEAYQNNKGFAARAATFLVHAQNTINPSVSDADVREMLIQHILTEEIFAYVFNDSDFHRQNNIASQLYALESEFFKGPVKRETLRSLEPYYATIRSTAALITSHTEKEQFLKVIYENFYKIYDKKKADRLGVVYTPSDIVRFIVEGADFLTQKHFGKELIDRGVEILDPAAGTGTFICELLEHFRGQPAKLAWKYTNELHANEVAILPYYVANLNIEATYAQITGKYVEFPSLCFVDTLDNVSGLGIRRGHQHDLLAALSDENVERVKRQNRAKISVVLGNPPYNANQQSENDNNKNRTYPHIDRLIKDTYIKQSTARKTKLYDMYTRFFRWATDRLGDDGVIAFISNNSFAKKANYDGFRKIAAEQFCEVYVIDFKGDARTSGEPRRREGDNIFENEIKVGVAISFLVKRSSAPKGCAIHYAAVRDFAKIEEKKAFISGKALGDIAFERVKPDIKFNWVGLSENDWDAFPPIASKATKAAKTSGHIRAIFKDYALGISTNRDEWLYGFDKDELAKKAVGLINAYNAVPATAVEYPNTLKWSRNLKRRLKANKREEFSVDALRKANYRPFVPRWLYQSSLFIDEMGGADRLFPLGRANQAICFSDIGSRTGTCILAIDQPADLHFGAAIDGYQQVPLYRFASNGERMDNITDWARRLFEKTYGAFGQLVPGRSMTGDNESSAKVSGRNVAKQNAVSRKITKESIFQYVYAVLYDPSYRETYAVNLRREFPRIPFYDDFWRWSDWGKELMTLHLGYECIDPWPLRRVDTPAQKGAAVMAPKVLLKASKDKTVIYVDSETSLTGVPPTAWNYELGNRSALDWVLDQHKEKVSKDPLVAATFNTYRFASVKEAVVALIGRVTRLSVETIRITEDMKAAAR